MVLRRSMLALATMFLASHACGPDDGYRDTCADVVLGEHMCAAHHKLTQAGARYGGYVEGEHRWLKDVRFCALRTDESGRVTAVRYLEPTSSWSTRTGGGG